MAIIVAKSIVIQTNGKIYGSINKVSIHGFWVRQSGDIVVYQIQKKQLTYQQPAQNGALTDQFCRAIYCIHLSIMPMQVAITIA